MSRARLCLLVLAAACGADRPEDGHDRMVRRLAAVRDAIPENAYFGDARTRALRETLAALPEDARPVDRIVALTRLGNDELRIGREKAAVERLEEALALAREHGDGARDLILYHLGVAHLRLGETENCCAEWSPESCVLPIRGRGVHEIPRGSQAAFECFAEVARSTPPGSERHRAAVWLLNLAAMTLGRHPSGVPEAFRIPAEAFASRVEFPPFPNVAAELGIANEGLAGGAACDDFDGDGDLDLFVSCWHPAAPLRYLRNDGGRFVEAGEAAGLGGILGGLNLLHADYDGDGDLDLLVLRGAWLKEQGRVPNSLLRNDGGGRFRDVTFEAGLGDVDHPTQTAAWADYDLDGDLDLYIGNEAEAGVHAPAQLFRNRGDGTFEDVARAAGVENGRYAKGVAWGDYDGDGDPDLYVSNYYADNRLYRNRGDGTFEDVAPALGVTGPHASFPVWFWDYDEDGHLDLFVAAYGAGLADVCDHYLGRVPPAEGCALYRGDGRGGFRDVAREAGLVQPTLPMGSNFGDLDHDGWLDFYLGTGHPLIESLMPNLMYRNREGRGFDDVTFAGRFGSLQKGHAVVFADLDHDGDQDVFQQMGGAYPVDPYRDALYENPGFSNRWVAVQLAGRRSNRRGVGARIRVTFEEGGTTRDVYRHVGTGGSFGGNPLRQTIGLGRATRIARIEVRWPGGSVVDVHEDPPLEMLLVITEGEADLDALALRPLPLRKG